MTWRSKPQRCVHAVQREVLSDSLPRDTTHALLHEPEVFLPLTGQLPAALRHGPGLADLEHRTP